jgi:hypothetical protein
MSRKSFVTLLDILRPRLTKEMTRLRRPVPADKRLAIALTYFATGAPLAVIANNYSCGLSTVRNIVLEVSNIIFNMFDIKGLPDTPDGLKKLSLEFEQMGGFPNVVGCIDGSHIPIMKPNAYGAEYFCYKKFFSIVLLAICDHKKRFLSFSVGYPGKFSDGGVYKESGMRETVNEIYDVCGNGRYHILGDSGFGLSVNLLKPFPQAVVFENESKRLFNYRLSKVRMVIEQSFGLLKMRFRCLHKRLDFEEVTNSILVTTACVHLHNWLIDQEDSTELKSDDEYLAMEKKFPQPVSDELDGIQDQNDQEATQKRDFYVNYFQQS